MNGVNLVKFKHLLKPFVNSNGCSVKYSNLSLEPGRNVYAKGVQSRLYSLASNFMAEDEKSDFDAVLPKLINDLTVASKSRDVPEIRDWFTKVLNYNIAGGKNIRGLNVAFTYKCLNSRPTNDDLHLSYILGWCVEMLQGFFLVLDDIMDKSATRRGRPAWYKLEEVGSPMAINDGLLIESGIYKILKLYFKNKQYYLNVMEIFHDTTLKTLYGQGLDLMASRYGSKREFHKFTSDRYNSIVTYKSGYYSFYLPVALAYYMAGIESLEVHAKSKEILLEIGNYFQVQDDFIDCFGDSKKTGKQGSDIEECKCTWFAVKALELCDSTQRSTFVENYGSDDPHKVAVIKNLYKDLGLVDLYRQYEMDANRRISQSIKNFDNVPSEIFTNLLRVLNRRSY